MCYADAEVLFDYEPTQEDELRLLVGSIIRGVKEVSVCIATSNNLQGVTHYVDSRWMMGGVKESTMEFVGCSQTTL